MQSDQSFCKSLEYSMIVKLMTEHHLEFLSLKEGCTGSSEFTLVIIPHCWNHMLRLIFNLGSFSWIILFSYFSNKLDPITASN